MPRKKVIRKSTEMEKIKDKIEAERSGHSDSINLVEHAGGSIDNLPVKTKAFNTWLDAHRANNPFIGKHVTSAHEEYTEEVRLGDDEEMSQEEMNAFLDDQEIGLGGFDPNSNYGAEAEEHGEALIGDGKHDTRFIDITIAENITNKLLGKSVEDIEKASIKAMRDYHSDDEYKPEIDLSKVIEESSTRLIEQSKSSNESLKITENKT